MHSADGGIAMGSVHSTIALTLMPRPGGNIHTPGVVPGLHGVVVRPRAQSAVAVVYSGTIRYLRLGLGHIGEVWGYAVRPVVVWHGLRAHRNGSLVVVCSPWRLH